MENIDKEDKIEELANQIIWRGNLFWNHTYEYIYEYLKKNLKEIDGFDDKPMTSDLGEKYGVSHDAYRFYNLNWPNDNETKPLCIIQEYNSNILCIPSEIINIMGGEYYNNEVMNFSMDVPENGDRSKKWTFKKQVVNQTGAYSEEYIPRNMVNTLICPLNIYEIAMNEAILNSYGVVSSKPDFVSYPIQVANLDYSCRSITVTPTDKYDVFRIMDTYKSEGEPIELEGESLYSVYYNYMIEKGYFLDDGQKTSGNNK